MPFYSRGSTRSGWSRLRRRELEDQVIHRKRMARRRRMNLLNSSEPVILPVDVVNNANSSGRRAFPEMTEPSGIVGRFVGEMIETGGGTWIWTGLSWAQYIWPQG